ncbi:putative tetratricopeptide (TRP) repeat protein [Waddlia chondrophila 2032/99]|uniref:Putative tetratricopeptide (TRP) repeat protein n=2 Tax=Waddlia chondrophila TaxID=71667 RepID=D6YUF8_WADCW|nr:SAM-dependent methyltransferase [Waddlia chondrophila]ADI37769.1 putative tetratricopeptide (TRP) repeat protein [Waddlia chondrophila WSU 86-1044]CCB91822.1 putative tetratricopeptide (TRP) repeat protein [Waddlia chondrophila 2032/99]
MKQLEKDQLFSKSILWDLQLAVYREFGPSAWAEKGVPFYLTSNPLLARQFVSVIESYFFEMPASNPSEPIYVFDLGAGSGRLAFLILKDLIKLRDRVPFVYVMTDMVEENLKFWRQHPRLKPYFEKGVLDCASYKNDQKEPLKLQVSGKILDVVQNPMVLICTYFFDTIPQDLFRVKNGKLEEGRISISVPAGSTQSIDPDWINSLEESYSFQPVDNASKYYPNEAANQILCEYVKEMEGATFLFPSGSLLTLEYFQKLSKGKMLLLAADQGVCSKDQIMRWGIPHISRHSSFSIAVNYHALARYFELHDGLGFLPSLPDHRFALIAGILGEGVYNQACLAFYKEMDVLQPVEYWHLTGISDEQADELSLKQLLILVKMGNNDPLNMHCFFKQIRDKLSEADEETLDFLKSVVKKCVGNFYPVSPSEGDFVQNMGVLLFEAKDYESAAQVFAYAASIKGLDAQLMQNLALCKAKIHSHL